MPPLQEVDPNIPSWTTLPRPKKRGPKPMLLKDRKARVTKPASRQQRSYTKKKKEEVVMWLIHHRVYHNGEFVPPSTREAEAYFLIPNRTIAGWKAAFCESYVEDRSRSYCPRWPGLKDQLYELFIERKSRFKVVTTFWFRMKSRAIFRDLYPSFPTYFTFSTDWYRGFLRRHNIIKRRITKQSTKRPEDYILIVNMFLQFIRCISSIGLQSQAFSIILHSPKRRFRKRLILNIDETPVPFEFLDGSTWEIQGAKTMTSYTDCSGWNKRQAILILYIFADGIHRLKPKLIFHGTPTEEGGQIEEKESHLYHPDVTVAFNKTAYNNKDLLLQ